MLRPRYHLILTTASSPRLGVLPFRSAAYVAPHPEDMRGSTCIHVAVSQALHLTMGRFGSRPVNQREFDALLWAKFSEERTLEDISDKGARLHEVLSVIEKCNAGAFIASFTVALNKGDPVKARREAHRCITDLLANGLAVIIAVDYAKLPQGRLLNDVEPRFHGALVFGMHLLHSPYEVHPSHREAEMREDFAELPGRFVGHDISAGPFVEWRVCDLLDAAFALYPPGSKDHGVHLLAIGPKNISLGLHRVRNLAIDLMLSESGDPQAAYPTGCQGTEPLDRENWRYVTRLIDLNEVLGRYFADADPELEIMLTEAFPTEPENVETSGYCWSVEVRLPNPEIYAGNAEIHPAIVYLWSITGSEVPRAVLRWGSPGEVQVRTRTGTRRFPLRL